MVSQHNFRELCDVSEKSAVRDFWIVPVNYRNLRLHFCGCGTLEKHLFCLGIGKVFILPWLHSLTLHNIHPWFERPHCGRHNVFVTSLLTKAQQVSDKGKKEKKALHVATGEMFWRKPKRTPGIQHCSVIFQWQYLKISTKAPEIILCDCSAAPSRPLPCYYKEPCLPNNGALLCEHFKASAAWSRYFENSACTYWLC